MLIRKTLKRKSIMTYQEQNSKQSIETVKYPSNTKNAKVRGNYQVNSGKLKL